jgi:hypothetical protein
MSSYPPDLPIAAKCMRMGAENPMEPESSMLAPDQDLERIAAPTDRRPQFTAEALSPQFRVGLLLATLIAAMGLVVSIASAAVSPGFLFARGLYGALLVGGTLTLSFAVFLVFGALVANNPHMTHRQRVVWYGLFALAGPVMLPSYWLMHVWPAPFVPRP